VSMKSKILIIYSSIDGHTQEICSRLKEILEEANNQVSLMAVNQAGSAELEAADKVVIGASIRYGKHSKHIYKFVNQHGKVIDNKSNAFFSVNAVARKPEKNTPETNPYLNKFLKQISWQPQKLAVFAGKIDYPKYNFFDRSMIRLIMWMTKGPTDPKSTIEFTDWGKVTEFGQMVNEM
jgi:menaquinone-dependent protoporphyrinogen oxidase